MARWPLQRRGAPEANRSNSTMDTDIEKNTKKTPKWSLGILNDPKTDEVPGSILLLSKPFDHNEPLGLRNIPARTSQSSLPSPFIHRTPIPTPTPRTPEKKRTKDGKIILEPQPEESANDPLNWPTWRRDLALLSLGFYCMIGGGMTPILAAGFNNVAATFNVTIPRVALTTGLYMMGLGLGSVIASPTAILFGKRPVYLVASIVLVLTGVWCALSPSYVSLLVARIIQGMAVSPVECLPSATIAEIYFLHERAYRLGIYTLLLLGGKNLVPLVAAAIVQSLGWRWIFWIVAIITGFGAVLLFLFVPETFWDRTPKPHKPHKTHHHWASHLSIPKIFGHATNPRKEDAPILADGAADSPDATGSTFPQAISGSLAQRRQKLKNQHVGFAETPEGSPEASPDAVTPDFHPGSRRKSEATPPEYDVHDGTQVPVNRPLSPTSIHSEAWKVEPGYGAPPTPELRNLNSPWYTEKADERNQDYFAADPPMKKDQERGPTRNSQERGDRSLAEALRASPIHMDHTKETPPMPELRNLNSPWYTEKANANTDYFTMGEPDEQEDIRSKESGPQPRSEKPREGAKGQALRSALKLPRKSRQTTPTQSARTSVSIPPVVTEPRTAHFNGPPNPQSTLPFPNHASPISPPHSELSLPPISAYTERHRDAPAKSFAQQLKPYSGRLSHTSWFRVMLRPFILFSYPAILWSTLVYSLSVGWLIVLSESVASIYRSSHTYNFTALQTGLVYVSPFVGGILGTAVAGKVSDIIVRFMAKRNDGVYEPEFRLIMAVPVAISTTIGLMGFGWSAQERDKWIVPTVFFGVISFGCSLGSTTSITFAVDSYRQYAGEALVTLNFSKNIFHGLVFSLFFTKWLEADGAKKVFIALGGIQLACLLLTIPMYIYGKRARMWTVRRNFMEKF